MITKEELAQVPFFERLDEEERSLLAGITRRVSAKAGERIFEQGETSQTLYVVIDGLVSLRQKTRDGEEEMSMAAGRPGELIGISAMLGEGGVHSVSGICLEPTELIAFDASAMMETLEKNPVVGFRTLRRLTHLLAQRLAAARAQLGSQIRPGLITHG